MSKRGSVFAGLSAQTAKRPIDAPAEPARAADLRAVAPAQAEEGSPVSTRSKGRADKKLIAGHFSAELSRRLRTIAAEEDTSVQALMGEAFDLLLRSRNKHPMGER